MLVALAGVGCGKKGPPLAPLRPVPARIEDLTARRIGDDVYLQFTVPSKNADGSTPADLERVDAAAITGRADDAFGRPLDARAFLKFGTPVASVAIEPPPPPPPKDGPPPPPPPPDPRPGQGERVTLTERLTPAARTVFEHPGRQKALRRMKPVEPDAEANPVPRPLTVPRDEPLSRVYVVAGRSRHDLAGPLSARLAVPLTETPEAPSAPTVRHDATRVVVAWTSPASARLRIQEIVAAAPAAPAAAQTSTVAAPVAPLPGRPLFAGAVPHTYNVYEYSEPRAGAGPTMPLPLNPKPLETLMFEDSRLTFGVERCYVVRMVEAHGAVTVESAASPPTCITPQDTFPPAAPRNLAAVGAEGAVNLIWEPNDELDLAGYIVLRGEAPGAKLEALTMTPIRETTFRDTTATPGVRYVYAVVAVDSATPQNVSVESNRVEEIAR